MLEAIWSCGVIKIEMRRGTVRSAYSLPPPFTRQNEYIESEGCWKTLNNNESASNFLKNLSQDKKKEIWLKQWKKKQQNEKWFYIICVYDENLMLYAPLLFNERKTNCAARNCM